ncbi:MAG: KEOPS complex N(6)-L-threonylcarbamoyladenine synthase Kae1 [archaeon]|nr:KEOPS complex N(6)-L-threonylcarbamoyladenine synthase Kae1 [archaeon]
MTIILGIESTAHTFGVAVCENGKVLSNVRDMYTTEKGGIVPLDSAKHHKEVCDKIYSEALEKAGVSEDKITAIAFSQGPGIPPCLLAGIHFVKKIAEKLKVPVVPVNHCIAHLEIGRLTGAKDPVLLYASGANTQIIAYAAGKYRVFGETLDIGVGNFIDTFARHAGIGFPGGPKIGELASKCTKEDYVELPYSIKGMDVSFAGLQTKLKQMLDRKQHSLEKLSYSMQETVFAMLIEASERALAHTGKKELLLGGGVACNSRLQEMAKIMCEERGCKFFCPERQYLIDNPAMIAYTGEIMFKSGIKVSGKDIDSLDIMPRERTDDVSVKWK